ncbi:hypothetical protein D3227_34770 [Mesorhizobium waimense]|uniref:Uncharacterized protein n=1 Tax=Mesorhizobium waimense TaxID=1300307 RepID=A0A3A5K0D4_9HYPH|nr:hypothetical protein [Mesorhizobium waimense]RJT28147.1 hypothetical protein D3227_34770 [Mesorhizobium waimense]
MAKTKKNRDVHPPELVQQFFARSDYLDTMVLRPLSHITMNWEASWDGESYSPEAGSFAGDLNEIIEQIADSPRPDRYHDNEDRLAERVIAELHWPIQKKGGLWVGADYQSILEQGAFSDLGQRELATAAAGRVHMALDFDQTHFDDMDDGHMAMLAGPMTIMIYHRYCDGSSVMMPDEDE